MVLCNFLFTYYTDIYNKIRKDEIDLTILFRAYDVLNDIETGKLDQHTGAYEFGVLLKKIYVDSALKRSEKLEETYKDNEKSVASCKKDVCWKKYKSIV